LFSPPDDYEQGAALYFGCDSVNFTLKSNILTVYVNEVQLIRFIITIQIVISCLDGWLVGD